MPHLNHSLSFSPYNIKYNHFSEKIVKSTIFNNSKLPMNQSIGKEIEDSHGADSQTRVDSNIEAAFRIA